MSRRKLPLDGSDWVPLAVVVQLFHERSGSLALGEADTMQALCENKVRSMCRCLGAQPERWLVPSGFWNNHEIFSTSDGVEVIARSSGHNRSVASSAGNRISKNFLVTRPNRRSSLHKCKKCP
jgi:hypothetical protein